MWRTHTTPHAQPRGSEPPHFHPACVHSGPVASMGGLFLYKPCRNARLIFRANFGDENETEKLRLYAPMAGFPQPFSAANQVDHMMSYETKRLDRSVSAESGSVVRARKIFSVLLG